MANIENNWIGFEKLLFKFMFAWVIIFSFSFSFPHQLVPDIGHYTAPFFERIVKWFAKNILHINKPYTSQLISDSTGLYIHALLVIFYALLITIGWSLVDKNKRVYKNLLSTFLIFIRYYLALQLFTYGFSKVFKWQFYLPEPNTLFTTLGQTPKDLLYWSTMGSSKAYTMFNGIVEVIAALLLLFRKTVLIGALLVFGIMINVVAINFSFDISVKLYSLFLLLLSCILIAPFAKQLYRFIILHQPAKIYTAPYFSGAKNKWYVVIKLIAIATIILDPLYLYIKENNFNDDRAERPLLHGAYEVQSVIVNDTVLPVTEKGRWKRFFVHRRGYFITQYENDGMQDYELQYDTTNKYLVLTTYENKETYNLHYQQLSNDTLFLQGEWERNNIEIKAVKIDMNKLPLLQHEFNWTIDG